MNALELEIELERLAQPFEITQGTNALNFSQAEHIVKTMRDLTKASLACKVDGYGVLKSATETCLHAYTNSNSRCPQIMTLLLNSFPWLAQEASFGVSRPDDIAINAVMLDCLRANYSSPQSMLKIIEVIQAIPSPSFFGKDPSALPYTHELFRQFNLTCHLFPRIIRESTQTDLKGKLESLIIRIITRAITDTSSVCKSAVDSSVILLRQSFEHDAPIGLYYDQYKQWLGSSYKAQAVESLDYIYLRGLHLNELSILSSNYGLSFPEGFAARCIKNTTGRMNMIKTIASLLSFWIKHGTISNPSEMIDSRHSWDFGNILEALTSSLDINQISNEQARRFTVVLELMDSAHKMDDFMDLCQKAGISDRLLASSYFKRKSLCRDMDL